MTTPKPNDQRLTDHRLYHDATMDTFTVRTPRWRFVRLFGRNPLVRASDRVEALVLVLAIVVTLVAVPIAAAIGTVVHESRSQAYAEQAQDRQVVAATVIDSAAESAGGKTMTVPARWVVGGMENTGLVKTRQALKPGDAIDIWVGRDGSQVDAPTPVRAAAEEAVVAAAGTWLSVAAAAAGIVVGTRAALDRLRHARWQHDFDNLVGNYDRPN